MKEIPGEEHHDRIISYHATTTLHATSDEVPWCSSFVNYCVSRAGFLGTNSAAARSWLGWGVGISEPPTGAVAILRRGSDPRSGHVGFIVALGDDFLLMLGGNQRNAVTVDPFDRDRVLGFRWIG